jgi:hypothetical protein
VFLTPFPLSSPFLEMFLPMAVRAADVALLHLLFKYAKTHGPMDEGRNVGFFCSRVSMVKVQAPKIGVPAINARIGRKVILQVGPVSKAMPFRVLEYVLFCRSSVLRVMFSVVRVHAIAAVISAIPFSAIAKGEHGFGVVNFASPASWHLVRITCRWCCNNPPSRQVAAAHDILTGLPEAEAKPDFAEE